MNTAREIMHKLHAELLNLVKKEAVAQPFSSKHNASYGGHNEKSYPLSNPQLRKIVKNWLKSQKDLTLNQFIALLNSLYQNSKSSTEKSLAGYLLEYRPKLRNQLDPILLDNWLEYLTGWAQIDSLCQSNFSGRELLDSWNQWETLLQKFNRSDNISKQRASLVLLTKPAGEVADERLAQIAIANIENLKHEKDILITKAISWLLRAMVKHQNILIRRHSERVVSSGFSHKNYRDIVEKYLKKNSTSLPRIAVRETTRKLKTGRK
ncbi:DNA alkylation repair protein [Patescibacteria group bacterium]|nr:DNA alkylation repair protein [Patescibacteria group bacterium]